VICELAVMLVVVFSCKRKLCFVVVYCGLRADVKQISVHLLRFTSASIILALFYQM
jgi:hypothetical protein